MNPDNLNNDLREDMEKQIGVGSPCTPQKPKKYGKNKKEKKKV